MSLRSTSAVPAPFLRAPPFPGIDPRVVTVSKVGVSTAEIDYPAVFDAVRRARVGGSFWNPVAVLGAGDGSRRCDPWSAIRDGSVEVDDPDGEQATVGWIAGARVADRHGSRISPARLEARAIERIDAAIYRNPFTDRPVDVFGAIEILAHWRSLIDANRPIVAVTGVAAWKRDVVARFVWSGDHAVPFLANRQAFAQARAARGTVAYWPSRTDADIVATARTGGVSCWQIEDGFIRSDGLGVECRPPYSVLIDRSGGIHYDPARPSDLETILSEADFDTATLARAAALRARIVAERIGKYGVDRGGTVRDLPSGRKTVLAVGQVEDDLSVRHGGGGIRSNLEFLRRIRAHEPHAYIVYRPHPDVLSGLRAGHVPKALAGEIVDHVDDAGALLPLVEAVDCVHVLSSLTGFEALLRGREVVVHGSPFYAGWGLTTDLATQPDRRTRRLTLDALVAGALILAPRYLDPVTMLPCQVETLIDRIVAGMPQPDGLLTRFRQALGATRRSIAVAQDRWR